MAESENNLWEPQDLSRVCFRLDMDHSLRGLHKDFAPVFLDSFLGSEAPLGAPPEGDQVVPSAQRGCSVLGQREARPLPPPPDPEELMADEAADQEVEFFTSDRRCLLPRPLPRPLPRAPCKTRPHGRVNRAYQDPPTPPGADAGTLAFSWPGGDRAAGGGGHFGAGPWDDGASFWTPPLKPQVPPRIPIKPKSLTDDDTPPKVPPRVPLVPPCPPRTPSPKSLPIYINGVMPATQSFAADPHYVSKSLQRRPEPAPPCIVPILKDGRQASATHYILLPPGRPPSAARRDRLQSDPPRRSSGGFWKKR